MILETAEAASVCARLRQEGKTIVFTNGCFDILHAGHVSYLERAGALGDFLVLGLNSDDSVRRLKGPSRPVNSQADRAVVMAALRSVDCVVIFSEDTPLELITALRPHVLVKGGDYTPETIVGAAEVVADGGRVEVLPFLDGRSTSSIIAKIHGDQSHA